MRITQREGKLPLQDSGGIQILHSINMVVRQKLQCVFLLGLLVVYWFEFARSRGPSYQGKSLTRLLETSGASLSLLYISTWWAKGEVSESEKPEAQCSFLDQRAMEAVSALDTNSIPVLLRMLEPEPPAYRWLRDVIKSRPALRKYFHFKDRFTPKQIVAVAAFQKLGPRAKAATPELIENLSDPRKAIFSLIALLAIHPEREPDFLSFTNCFGLRSDPMHCSENVHGLALLGLSTYGTQAFRAAPFLLSTLKTESNCWVRACSAVALARIGATAELAVPAILRDVESQPSALPSRWSPKSWPGLHDDEALQMCLWSLGRFGKDASNALEVLPRFQEHPDGFVGEVARNSIERIQEDLRRRGEP